MWKNVIKILKHDLLAGKYANNFRHFHTLLYLNFWNVGVKPKKKKIKEFSIILSVKII
jgi:hypothetical protein